MCLDLDMKKKKTFIENIIVSTASGILYHTSFDVGRKQHHDYLKHVFGMLNR